MESIKQIYKIGLGPSSSHTMGPRKAAEEFLSHYPGAARYEVTLYGSLAATGKGHLTDKAILSVLEPAAPTEIVWQPEVFLPFHPNAMRFRACDAAAPLDRVFSNAGVATGPEIEPNVRRTFAVNVGGTVNVVLPAVEAMRARRCGHVVMTASIAGYGPLAGCPSYAATKSCVKTWGLSLRGHLRAEGVRVSVICPGFVRSRMTDKNTCPMPFFMEADRAARIILRRVDRNVGLIAFPWPMRFATWWLSTLPFWLNDLLGRLLPKNFKKA